MASAPTASPAEAIGKFKSNWMLMGKQLTDVKRASTKYGCRGHELIPMGRAPSMSWSP